MSQIAQVRINKTKEVDAVLNFLKKTSKYKLLDDSELVKVALSELYSKALADLSIDNENHPFYNTLTPEEELGVKKSLNDINAQKTVVLSNPDDINTFFANL